MKATVDESCVACEKCCDICPEVFQMGDDYAEVIVGEIPPE
jgi:ferredoxin